jgi:ankyrin repeat protein
VSVLHTASAAGHAAIVQLLLERGASPWALLSDPKQLGATPLAVAAQAGQAECVALLLDEPHLQFAPAPPADTVAVTTKAPLVGASKNSSSNASKPAAVAKRAKAPLAPYRASNGQSVGTLGDSEPTATGALPAAAGAEMAAELPVLGPLGSRLIATPMTDGRTPLHLACQHGAIETARVLIGAVRSAAPTLIDAVDAAGLSPLDRACQSGHVVVVKLLLETGATWRREGALNGSTALHVAVEAGKPACVAALLEAKADPEQSDSAGRSPLLLATELGRKECALAMLSAPHLVGVPYPEVSVDVWRAWLTEPFADLGRERAARAALA